LDLDEVTAFCAAAMPADGGTLLIEGVGGALVPLGEKTTVCDLMAALKIPAILVAGTYLGTISHTLTTAEALMRRGIRIKAIVLSESRNAPVTPDETAASINRFLPAKKLHIIPRDLNDRSFRELAATLV
jgi:dethiobiotin synthetase